MQKKPQIGNDLRLKVTNKSVKFLFFFIVLLTGCTPESPLTQAVGLVNIGLVSRLLGMYELISSDSDNS